MSPPQSESSHRREVHAAEERAEIRTKLTHVEAMLIEMKSLMLTGYVTRSEFAPVKGIVFGLVGLIIVGVFAALIKLVIKP